MKCRDYTLIAKSQTGAALGRASATGDVVKCAVIVPETTAPGVVSLIDGSSGPVTLTLYTGGTVGADLRPWVIDFGEEGVISRVGGWTVTTGDNVHVIFSGAFKL